MFVNFRKYVIKEQAQFMSQILDDNEIPNVLREVKPTVDITFTNSFPPEYWIQISEHHFETAEILLNEQGQNIETVPEGHYLLDFKNDELEDILKNYSDWNETDFHLARKILNEKGITFKDEDIERFKEEKLDNLRKPTEGKTGWIIVGFISAFLGGLIGIGIGWIYWTDRKTLPNGERVYRYTSSTRQKGKIMTVIGLFVLVIGITLKLIYYSG